MKFHSHLSHLYHVTNNKTWRLGQAKTRRVSSNVPRLQIAHIYIRNLHII